MNTYPQDLLDAVVREVQFRLQEESLTRIKKCLEQLTEQEVWQRPNENLVSVGNLILHLGGNIRQYIMFGLGGQPDRRQRQSEFEEKGPIPKEKLLNDLDRLMKDVNAVLDDITPEILTKEINVQGTNRTGFGILMHVVEHFSYHTGQITWHTKLVKNIDMKYFEGRDLNITG